MINRYSRKELTNIWSEENKYKIWLDVEIAAAQAMEKYRLIPKGVASVVKRRGRINVKRIHQIEGKVKHDIIAFLTSITEKAGIKARYLHQGMTSSDVLDTSFNIQLLQSGKILMKDIEKLLSVIKKKALKHKMTPCIGRSHGIHAEPITFGLKLATYYEEFKRNKKRLENAINEVSTCAISGAVGTFANIDPRVEIFVSKKLKLKPEPISTQIIPRDRHAYYFSVLGIIAGSIERFATEIRHLQRSEVYELQEFFSKGQKGSSAMPHKRNPVLSENLTGISRLIRSYVIPSMENITLWHERDISHSSVERMMAPDANVLTDFSLARMTNIISNLVVYPKNMMINLNKLNKLPMSEGLMLALTQKGLPREKAYKMIQRNAMEVWKSSKDFSKLLIEDKEVRQHLSDKEINQILDINHSIKKTNQIFKKIFKK